MPELATMTVVGIVVAAVLIAIFVKVRQRDLIDAIVEQRRGSSQIITRAEYVEGAEMMPVALSLANGTIYYSNPDFDASLDVDRIDEIEYADELATGKTIRSGCRVLRLRSHGTTFEFLLDRGDCEKWAAALPARMYGDSRTAATG